MRDECDASAFRKDLLRVLSDDQMSFEGIEEIEEIVSPCRVTDVTDSVAKTKPFGCWCKAIEVHW